MVHHPIRLSYDDQMDESTNQMEHTMLEIPVRGQRRGRRRMPIKVLHSISSGIRKGAKLVRGNRRRGNRSRSRQSAGVNSPTSSAGKINHPSMPPSRASVRSLSSRSRNSFEQSNMPVRVVDQEIDDIQSQVLVHTESFLRYLLVLIGVYLLGMQQPLNPSLVWNLGHVVGVAWATCFAIRFVSWILSDRSAYIIEEEVAGTEQMTVQRESTDEVVHNREQRSVQLDFVDEESEIDEEEAEESSDDRLMYFDDGRDLPPSLQGKMRRSRNSKQGRLFHRRQNRMAKKNKFTFDSEEKQSNGNTTKRDETVTEMDGANSKIPKQLHPELEDLWVMNKQSGERMIVGEIEMIDNEHFSGKCLVMCRTSDADMRVEPENTGGTDLSDIRSNYFRKKQRRFEIQLQIKFKKAPPSRIYFGAMLDEPIKLGIVQKCFLRATLNFIEKKNNGGFVYNVPGKEARPDELLEGTYERPHLVFAVEKAFDRLVETKEGDTPPTLGIEIHEDPKLKKLRQNNEFSYNTTSTYTFGLWSAYGDFAKWQCMNLPAIRPFSFGSLIREQCVSLQIYYLNAPEGEKRHLECHKELLINYELSNVKYSGLSKAKTIWMGKYSRQTFEDLPLQNNLTIEQSILPGDDSEMSSDSDGSDSDGDNGEEQVSFDDDEETRALEEMGEGIYLKYGEPIELKEAAIGGGNALLTNGGGFATLQRDKGATIVLERVHRRSPKHIKTGATESTLIKNGDTVMVKLEDQYEPLSYLSIHKGWWLKWVQRVPRNSGLYVIHTNDVESIDAASEERSGIETQSSHLRVGGTFHLCAKSSGRQVGVRVNNSTKIGGRVLGLYKSGSYYVTENDLGRELSRGDSSHSTRQMMMPLKLCACLPSTDDMDPEGGALSPIDSPIVRAQQVPIADFGDCNIDSPAWLEIMHRSKRRVFRVYAIRILRSTSSQNENENSSTDHILRLRTGKEITPLLRFGATSGTRRFDDNSSEEGTDFGRTGEIQDELSADGSNSMPVSPINMDLVVSNYVDPSDSESSIEGKDVFSRQIPRDDLSESEIVEPLRPSSPTSGARKKKKWIQHTTYGITKVAKGVKTGTVKSGTIIGKAVTYTIKGGGLKKRHFLRDKPRKSKGNRIRDHHVAVNKALKTMHSPSGRRTSLQSFQTPNTIMAGQLTAPDQSCRTVSYILKSMSSTQTVPARPLFSAHFSTPSDIDTSFLSGGPVELGVDLDLAGSGTALGEYIVARALWDNHWLEEASVIHESNIDFYAPLSNKAHVSIPFYDIQRVRIIDEGIHPLPGYPLLSIETSWKCHYLAFKSYDIRQDFLDIINKAIFADSKDMNSTDQWKARMWQSLQSSADSSGKKTKWAPIMSSKKHKQRIILNSRRMPFDCDEFTFQKSDKDLFQSNLCAFVENLLRKALSFSLENLMSSPEDFVRFLDETSRLRTFPLSSIDKSGKGGFCIFVNLYHCLLQHALLLATGGPPTKKNVMHFMRTHCYEIGGDVFSLAELETCVIRGNLPKPYYPKPPFIRAPKKSRGYLAYALEYVDPRLCFVVNNGNKVNSPLITILKATTLDNQLTSISRRFLNSRIKIDLAKKSVTLPKVCDVYRNDFDERDCINFCLQFLHEDKRSMLLELMQAVFTVRYEYVSDQFYTNLKLQTEGGP